MPAFPAHARKMVRKVDDHVAALPCSSGVRRVPFSRLYALPNQIFFGDCFPYRDRDHLSRCGEALVARTVMENRALEPLLGD